jgi:hypothetical protein
LVQLGADNSAWLKPSKTVLRGISGFNIDYLAQTGTAASDHLTDFLSKFYDAKAKEFGDSRISGIKVKCENDKIRVHQSLYLLSLKLLPSNSTYDN